MAVLLTRRPAGLIVLAYVGFLSLGLPDGVVGVAWPSVRGTFHLSQASLGVLSVTLGTAYILSSFFAGRAVARFGVGTVLWSSSVLATAGFAAHAWGPAWPVFASGAALVGLGSGAVDAALNVFVARAFTARQMNWLHACYSTGAWIGPLVMAAAIHRSSWREGYAVLGAVLLGMALLFVATARRWGGPVASSDEHAGAGAALRQPRVRLAMAVFFVYTGLEATFGAWSYTVLVEGRGLAHATAVGWVALYFGSIVAGRVLFGIVVGRWDPDRLVRAGTWGAATGAALFAVGPDVLRGPSLGLIGLSLAPVFPCLMARTPDRLGPAVAVHAIGFQVSAATLGAALCPALGGLLSDAAGMGAVPVEAVVLAGLLWALHERLLRQ